jgi:hypothetical protein
MGGSNKFHQMNNHLRNILVVYRELNSPVSNAGSGGLDNQGLIASTSDYFPVGVQLDGRTKSNSGYRYGLQGQEGEMKSRDQDGRWKMKSRSVCWNSNLQSRIRRRCSNLKDSLV